MRMNLDLAWNKGPFRKGLDRLILSAIGVEGSRCLNQLDFQRQALDIQDPTQFWFVQFQQSRTCWLKGAALPCGTICLCLRYCGLSSGQGASCWRSSRGSKDGMVLMEHIYPCHKVEVDGLHMFEGSIMTMT